MATLKPITYEPLHKALIQHNKAAEILLERGDKWKLLIKSYIAYFEGAAELENIKMTKIKKNSDTLLSDPVTVNHFLPSSEPGILELTNTVKEFNKREEKFCELASKFTTNEIVKELKRLKADIKTQISKCKDEIGDAISTLNKRKHGLETQFANLNKINATSDWSVENDPWLAYKSLEHQLDKALQEEKLVLKSFQSQLTRFNTIESGLMNSIKSILNNYFAWLSNEYNYLDTYKDLVAEKTKAAPDESEWKHFINGIPELSIFETNDENITFEDLVKKYQENADYKILKNGQIIKKGMFGVKEQYCVLTNTGFIHTFKDSNIMEHKNPEYSITLKDCIVQPSLKEPETKLEINEKMSSTFSKDRSFILAFTNKSEFDEWLKLLYGKVSSLLVSSNPSTPAMDAPPVDKDELKDGTESDANTLAGH